jgi:MSHA biogenesis protein MshO
LKSFRLRDFGFTLVEMIMVIAITGVLAAMVAVFMKSPIEGFINSSRRATLLDVTSVALWKIAREVHRALPNSVRVSANGLALEFIPTLAAGRYEQASSTNCFTSAKCSSLKSLGTVSSAANQFAGKSLVIFNYYNNSGGNCALGSLTSVYCLMNSVRLLSSSISGGQETFTFVSSIQFVPAGGSPFSRFQIVDSPVSYVCDTSNGVLRRYWGYAVQASQSLAPGGSSAVLASGIPSGGCLFQYQTGIYQRLGVVVMRLTVASSGESVSLYQEAHVDNAP